MTGKANNAALDLKSGAASDANDAVSEPTMEEILASIREIISDDEPDDGLTPRERYQHPTNVSNANAPADATPESAGASLENAEPQITAAAPVAPPTVAKPVASPPAASGPDDDMLEIERLANAIRAREDAATQQPKPVPAATAQAIPTRPFQAPPSPPVQVRPVQEQAAPRPQMVHDAPVPVAQPETSEIADSVARMMLDEHGDELRAALSELMKPVVRKWLGDNLPTMVERLVRDEIERASRGG